MMPAPRIDLPTALAELAGIDLAGENPDHVLGRVAELARCVVPGATEVAVLVLQADRGTTAASTGPVATHLDQWQYRDDHGPSLEATRTGAAVVVKDMASELRWPGFSAAALARGINSSMSIALPVQHALAGSITFYATGAGAFDDEVVKSGETFAAYAAVVVARTTPSGESAVQAEDARTGMQARVATEQAKGVLMHEHQWSPDEAARILARASRETDRPVDEIAQTIIETTQP